mmetsp:Transcript_17402/g.41248  ORF Transcript_17402/g.41248 Transcript_17402/m.41248 type:complete len:370 (+) Transcript_17402:983-2092(+)
MRRRHMKVVEVEVRQGWIVQVRTVNHPYHPVAERLHLRRFFHRVQIGEVVDFLKLSGKVLIDGFSVNSLGFLHLKSESRVNAPRLVGGSHGIRRLWRLPSRSAADQPCGSIQGDALRQCRLHGEAAAGPLELRLNGHGLPHGVREAGHGVAEVRGGWQHHGELHLRAGFPVLAQRSDDEGLITNRGAGAADPACGRVEEETLRQRRSHRVLLHCTVHLRQYQRLIAEHITAVHGRIPEVVRLLRPHGDGKAHRLAAAVIVSCDLKVRGCLRFGGRPVDAAGGLIEGEPWWKAGTDTEGDIRVVAVLRHHVGLLTHKEHQAALHVIGRRLGPAWSHFQGHHRHGLPAGVGSTDLVGFLRADLGGCPGEPP